MINAGVAILRPLSLAAASTPSAPTISAVNDGTGTSATITVDGDAGVTNRLRYRRTNVGAWTTGLTRSGDGAIQQTGLTQGNYQFLCVSDAGGVYSLPSNVVSLRVYDTAATAGGHVMGGLLSLIRAAIEEDAALSAILHVYYLIDLNLIPPEAEFPAIGLLPAGSQIEHGPGQEEILTVRIAVYQEIALDDKDAPGMMGYGLASPTIRQKGCLELLQEVRDLLNRQGLTGYYQGRLLEETAPEVQPIGVVVDEASGQVTSVDGWALRAVATYEYRAFRGS